MAEKEIFAPSGLEEIFTEGLVYDLPLEEVLRQVRHVWRTKVLNEGISMERRKSYAIMVWLPPTAPCGVFPHDVLKKDPRIKVPHDINTTIVEGHPIPWEEQLPFIEEYYRLIEREQSDKNEAYRKFLRVLPEIEEAVRNQIRNDLGELFKL